MDNAGRMTDGALSGDHLNNLTVPSSRGLDQPSFHRSPPVMSEQYAPWTQFSGIPSQPGSPSSLHQVFNSMEIRNTSSDFLTDVLANRIGSGFQSSGARHLDASNDQFDFDTAHGKFLPFDSLLTQANYQSNSSGNLHHTNMPQGFEFGASPDFDFVSPQPQLFSQTAGKFPGSPTSDFIEKPYATFSHADFLHSQPDAFPDSPPSANYSFRTHPDFSCPPPLHFSTDRSRLSPSVISKPLKPEFVSSIPQSDFSHHVSSNFHGENLSSQHLNTLSNCQSGLCLPTSDEILKGLIDVSVPPPNFLPFDMISNDVFQGSGDVHEFIPDHGLDDISSRQEHHKIMRQNSEPIHGSSAAQQGKAIYMEAFKRLNSFGPSYEPFGSQTQVYDNHLENSSVVDEMQTSTEVRNEPLRPSYSDVAKSARGKSLQIKPDIHSIDEKEKDDHESRHKIRISDTWIPKPFRQHSNKQQVHSKPPTRLKLSSQETSKSFVTPNSKYGLDQFEDVAESSLSKGEVHTSSAESLNSHSYIGTLRRSSSSSLSSNTSGVEEIQQGRSGIVPGSFGGCVDANKQKIKPSNLDAKIKSSENCNTNSSGSVQQNATVLTTSNAASAPQKTRNEKVFFDPKRIFQTRGNSREKSKEEHLKGSNSPNTGIYDGDVRGAKETVLNNGKPNNINSKGNATAQRKTDYINNDLREINNGSGSKRTNQTAALGRNSQGVQSRRHMPTKDSVTQNGASDHKHKESETRTSRQDSTADNVENENQEGNSFFKNIDWVLVDDWMTYFCARGNAVARSFFTAILTVLLYLLGVIMYLITGTIHLIVLGTDRLWAATRRRIFKGDDQIPGGWKSGNNSDILHRRSGLEENITLPSTGEEAMKRLLACKGKDPYSILGLRVDASDEDIKRYYRRQAVLVHPDKNQEPGAEEAFKILGHAFEMIGEPTKRKQYDAHILEASEAEAAMKEFSDMLTKLQEKIQEAANMMRCDNCGNKHKRIPIDRPWYCARYCDRCNIHHSAKEGDVWAETSMLGFLWHYYACMEGSVYDITEWVSCQREHFTHMKANAHPVFYRIQTDGNRRHRHGQSGEAELEDFINRLFNKASMAPDGNSSPGWQPPSQNSSAQAGWGNSATNSKKSRRKKKKH